MPVSRDDWDATVDSVLKQLVGLGIEEAWPELLDHAWQNGTPARMAASDIAQRLHDKYGVAYVQAKLHPWS